MYFTIEYMLKDLKKGFTLIELMVVIGIIGVLAAGLVATINPFTQFAKARDARRKSDLKTITTLLNEYYNDNSKYPPAADSSHTCAPQYGSNCQVWSSDSGVVGPWIQGLGQYTKSLPVDPTNSGDPRSTGHYAYAYGDVSADGQHYSLYTQLENHSDPDRCELKDYIYDYGFLGGPLHWCINGGSNSIYIFQLNHE